jgi:putative tryptophan/tyrosine transport system substrate-binding protein
MIRRREFITLLGGTAAWPLAARAQQLVTPTIGFLRPDTPAAAAEMLAAFRKGLSETGFVEGRNLAIEFRFAQNNRERQTELAADLIRRKVDVIAAPGSASGALAAKALTSTIPIVFSTSGDPIQIGLVASLNRPGGNVTGFTDMSSEIVPRQIGLLHELLPRATRFCVLATRTYPWIDRVIRDSKSSAASIGGQADAVFTDTDHEIDAAFADLSSRGFHAILVPDDAFFYGRQSQILTLAANHRMPTLYFSRTFAAAGGLLSYGPPATDQGRQAGIYTGRILRGEKPAELPVARATRFEFIINLAAARVIGLEVPPTLLALADEVIE